MVESFDDDEATPCRWMAAAVVAVAAAMACLPAVISIIWRGDQTPAATGLGLLGFSLLCLKIVSVLYAVGASTAPARRVAESVKPEPSQPVERTTARVRIAAG